MGGIALKERALGREFVVWDNYDDVDKAEKDLAIIKAENPNRDVWVDRGNNEPSCCLKEDSSC